MDKGFSAWRAGAGAADRMLRQRVRAESLDNPAALLRLPA
jgi:hypothetical protein